ncbi:MAG: hypothetical protein ACFFAS_17455 [Promethearchaeota archaeon]
MIAYQVSFFINALFDIDSLVIISTRMINPPAIFVPYLNHYYYITMGCIAAPLVSIVMGFMLCIPSSVSSTNKKRFIFKKLLLTSVLLLLIHVLNIVRIIFMLMFTYFGFSFEPVHDVLMYSSAIIGASIIIFMLYKKIPEVFIGFYYVLPLLQQTKKFKKKMIGVIGLFLFLIFLMIYTFYSIDFYI